MTEPGPSTKTLLLVGSSRDVLEAKRVVLEGAGYTVHALDHGASARAIAEEIGASLIIIDVKTGGPDVRAALEQLSASASPSSIPVLIIGTDDALRDFDGPVRAISKPADKRELLDSTRTLVQSTPEVWAKKRQ
jgi:DNA-binding response OmpR family regulator